MQPTLETHGYKNAQVYLDGQGRAFMLATLAANASEERWLCCWKSTHWISVRSKRAADELGLKRLYGQQAQLYHNLHRGWLRQAR